MPDTSQNSLTLAFVRRIQTPGRYYDKDGLILTVNAGGGKNWTQRITIDGRRRDMGLGSAHLVTPTQARRMAAANRAAVRAGRNPFTGKPTDAARHQVVPYDVKSVTFAKYNADRYRKLLATASDETHVKKVYARIQMHVHPVLGHRPLSRIQPADLAAMLEALALKNQATARWIRTKLVKIFADAVEDRIIAENPVQSKAVVNAARLAVSAPEVVQTARDWSNILDSLPAFLAKIEADPRKKASFLMIRFCLLTARNPKECRLATWSQIDMVDRAWRFPHMQQAGAQEVSIELHDGLLDIMKRASGFAQLVNKGYVFPSRKGHNQPYDEGAFRYALKTSGYNIRMSDFHRGYVWWCDKEGGGDLVAWDRRLRPH